MSAPERIWAWDDTGRYAEEQGIREGSWDDQVPPPDNTLKQTEYIRADLHDAAIFAARAEIAELKRQVSGGCDANHGNEHTVIREGTYAFCAHCGESLRGVRFVHLPRTIPEAQP